jgi:hypothetical protein
VFIAVFAVALAATGGYFARQPVVKIVEVVTPVPTLVPGMTVCTAPSEDSHITNCDYHDGAWHAK